MQFQPQVALDHDNSFQVTATAARLARVTDEATLLDWAQQPGRPPRPFLLGGGSNLLLTRDLGPDEPVLQLALRGRQRLGEDADSVLVEAQAGEVWHDFVQWTLAQGWSGLENLSLIPGWVGAAPVQNIGAYGVEMAQHCVGVTAVDLQRGELRHFSPDECAFGYRDSVFKHGPRDRYAITRVRFRLDRHFRPRLDYGALRQTLADHGITTPTARAVADAVIAIRRSKLPDPAQLGNAGSFFKNPIVPATQAQALLARHPAMPHYPADAQGAAGGPRKLAAGWLIEQAGWKGRSLGRAGVHAQHALVLVNLGGATGREIASLAAAIQASVQAQFGVALEIEPRVV